MNEDESSLSIPLPASASSSSAGSLGTKVHVQAVQANDSLFVLHNPPGTPQMQVLFFHGLQFENSSDMHLSTWKCGDGSCWPQTWLVEEFPHAQIFCVSYNGCVENDAAGVLDMHRVGENLTSDLIQENIGQIIHCPVILVGHSFGGLVIKQLCTIAHEQVSYRGEGSAEKERLEKFLGNIRGIFYYATPHHGSPIVERIAKRRKENPLLQYFKILSSDTARLNQKFDHLLALQAKWKTYALGESLNTKLDHIPWSLSFAYWFNDAIMVPEASARAENFYTVNGADHYTICKPSNKTSASFLKLKEFLCEIVTDMEVDVKLYNEAKAREENRFDNFQVMPKHLAGIEAGMEEITRRLDKAATVGIVGMGGLGKSTLAKAIFNKMGQNFEYSCFVHKVKLIEGHVDDVREKVWKYMHRRGKKVAEEENWSSLKGKPLFLVLDDVSDDRDLETLSSIAKDTSSESRFILTSRNQRLLINYDLYEVSVLDQSSSKQLFLSHAFAEQQGPSDLENLVRKIVRKCDGLPLALEVLGKSLSRQKDRVHWEQTLNALTNVEDVTELEKNLWAVLRASYDLLTKTEQEIFLDVTTFFSGNSNWSLWEAKAAWRVVYNTKSERLLWQTLVNLSLVYDVKEDETIRVHEQLQSVGRRIASEREQKRIWEATEGSEALQTINVVDKEEIHALRLIRNSGPTGGYRQTIYISDNALHKLKGLHYLDVEVPIVIDQSLQSTPFPTKLVLLSCDEANFSQLLLHPSLRDSLVGLKLRNLEKLKELEKLEDQWTPNSAGMLASTPPIERMVNEIGHFSNLEVLVLHGGRGLRNLPDTIVQLSKLKHLVLDEFMDLHTLPETFGALSSLKYLEIKQSDNLALSFAQQCQESFWELPALSHSELCRCEKLHFLPESFWELSSLEYLMFTSCDELESLPDSFGQLRALSHLQFGGCDRLHCLPESFGQLRVLNHLEFHDCDELHTLPESFGQLRVLNHLEFHRCSKLHSLPESFGQLQALSHLEFRYCKKLQCLPKSFGDLSSLTKLKFSDCYELDNLPESFGQLQALSHLVITNCNILHSLPQSFGDLQALNFLRMFDPEKLPTLPESLNYLQFRELENCNGAELKARRSRTDRWE